MGLVYVLHVFIRELMRAEKETAPDTQTDPMPPLACNQSAKKEPLDKRTFRDSGISWICVMDGGSAYF